MVGVIFMAPWPVFVAAGAVIGLLVGLFGVGGSSIATPLLAALGVPGLLAVASPLPATIPAALGAAVPYLRNGTARPRAAGWTLLGSVPAAIGGAFLSQAIGGSPLLIASGVVLAIVGVRVLKPLDEELQAAGTIRRKNRLLLVAVSAGVGLFAGLLANGGGFLLVPMYLVIFGLDMRQASGTSLLVISVLTVPILAAHAALGHINWTVAGAFALGAVPTSILSGQLAQRTTSSSLQKAFGWFLVASGIAFVLYRILGA
jgi:uncharacterized membrane protein YfcA